MRFVVTRVIDPASKLTAARQLDAETASALLGALFLLGAVSKSWSTAISPPVNKSGEFSPMSCYVDYQTVAAIFDAMRTETVDGMPVSEMVGGGYPMPVAIHFMNLLVDHADLSPRDRVLDIGCGCGRLAATLTQHIGPQGSYRGVDIVAGLVDFANRHIAQRFPNFSFVTLQRENPAYDAWRHEGASPTISSLEQACAPESVDLCLATSLFTHLDTDMARENLKAMRRALVPNGRVLISMFLLDPSVRALIRKGRAAFQFEQSYSEGVYVQNPRSPLSALAFTFDHFVQLAVQQEFYVERVLYGSWPGRPHYVSGQDIVIVRRGVPD